MFDEWVKMQTVSRFAFFEKNKSKLDKAVKLEEMVFSQARTNIVSTDMTRRAYILAKLIVSKLSEALTALTSNYDHQSPTAYHAFAVIQQLINDLSIFTMGISVMEVYFTARVASKAHDPLKVHVNLVGEVAKSPPKDTASSTLAPSPSVEIATAQPQKSFSLCLLDI